MKKPILIILGVLLLFIGGITYIHFHTNKQKSIEIITAESENDSNVVKKYKTELKKEVFPSFQKFTHSSLKSSLNSQTFQLGVYLKQHFDSEYETETVAFDNSIATFASSKYPGSCSDVQKFEPKWSPLIILQDKTTGHLKALFEIKAYAPSQVKEQQIMTGNNLYMEPKVGKFKYSDKNQLLVWIHDNGSCGSGRGYTIALLEEKDDYIVPFSGLPWNLPIEVKSGTVLHELVKNKAYLFAEDIQGTDKERKVYDVNKDGVLDFAKSDAIFEPNSEPGPDRWEDRVYPLDGVNHAIPLWWKDGLPVISDPREPYIP